VLLNIGPVGVRVNMNGITVEGNCTPENFKFCITENCTNKMNKQIKLVYMLKHIFDKLNV